MEFGDPMVTMIFRLRTNRIEEKKGSMMKDPFKKLIFPIILLLLFAIPGEVSAIAVNFSNAVTGKVLTNGERTGWTSTSGEIGRDGVPGIPQYLELDSNLVDPNAGGVRFIVERHPVWEDDGKTDYEVVFSLSDDSRKSLVSFGLLWENAGETQLTITGIKNAKRDGLWPSRIGLGRLVKPGESIEILLTWGSRKQDNRLFVDGQPVDISYFNDEFYIWDGPEKSFGDHIEGLSSVMVGVESPDGSEFWSPLNDTILWELEFIGGPEISSVSHDAFAVAGYSGKLVEGDTYTVTLKAESGGTATFDLVQPATTTKGVTTPEKVRIASHGMKEDPDNPGTYMGVHIVKYGEDVEDGLIVGHYANKNGVEAEPAASQKALTVDTKVYMEVKASNDLIPADENSRAGVTIVATDANGKHIKEHQLELTMSTTDEYTGIVGGGTFEDMVGGEIEVDWRGVTDSFGEVTAQYISGFAAKTILVSAKDMVSGDVGVGYVRSYIEGTVDVLVKNPAARALAVAGSMEVSLSRDWLTADGRSRSRITAVVKDVDGNPLEGDEIAFTLIGDNGKIRAVKSRTDSRGRAFADYIAGIVIGQVQIEVRDMTSGLVAVVSIELRPDAPAEISLTAEPAEIYIGDADGSLITAKVTDANGNPNANTDVLYEVITGGGSMSADSAVTDEKDGIAEVSFLPGDEPGVSTIKATVMSRPPTEEEIAAAEGAIFLYGLDEEPIRLEVLEWLAEPEDEVVEGQDLVVLEDRRGDMYIVKAPRDGILSVFTAEERDRVEYGQTLGYVLPLPE
jgi:biotin carboxyl carrier protein